MPNLCGVRFKEAGKVFYFDAGDLEVHPGTYVVADTAHGIALGRVVIAPDQVLVSESREDIKPLLRLATQEDIEMSAELRERAKAAADLLRRKVSEGQLGMSIAGADFDLDGSSLTAYFTAPERVDFRGLIREVSRELDVRVQLLQVGERDRAKLVDGVDICGERLCCASWMTGFPSVSIRMAKEQDLPLNPQKISGVCGRLYCCLTFEYEDYKALRGTLPKVGAVLSTPAGEAKVSGIDFNREVVKLVLTATRTAIEIAAIDFKLQHGLTVRPMDLVRKIEAPLRTVSEDSGAAGRRPGRAQREAKPRAEAPREPKAPRPAPGKARAETAPPPTAARQPAPSPEAPPTGPKRRRRRRRGRGGGGGSAAEA